MKNIKLVSEKSNKIVTRRNDFIEARFRLSLQEQRLMYWVMSCIEPDDEDFKTYRISISELAKVIGSKDKDIYGRLKEITKKVMGRIIELKSGDDDIIIPLINKAIYHRGKGTVDVRLDEDLKKYLLQLKDNFTSVKVVHLFALSSTYAMRIYELLAQYKKIGERTILLSELRKMLNIKPEQYLRFDHFETRILKKSHWEINNKTEINFDYEKIKRGGKVHSIKFVMRKKEAIKTIPKTSKKEGFEVNRLLFYGVSDLKAKALVKDDLASVTNALRAIKEQKKELKNPAGWLVKYIEDGWLDSSTVFSKNNSKTKEFQSKKSAVEALHEHNKTESFKAYSKYVGEEILNFVEDWSADVESAKWEIIQKQDWRLIPAKVMNKEGVGRWTTFLNRDIVLEYLTSHEGFSVLTKENFISENK